MAHQITKTAMALSKAGKEMKKSPPGILAKTAKKAVPLVAVAQRKAILLSKARQMGGKIPQKANPSQTAEDLQRKKPGLQPLGMKAKAMEQKIKGEAGAALRRKVVQPMKGSDQMAARKIQGIVRKGGY